MPNTVIAGMLIGFVFGLVLVFEGAGAAGLVLLFAAVGLVVGLVVWLWYRVMTGQVEGSRLRELISTIMSGRAR